MAALDAWVAEQPEPKPSRPEAIRRLIELGLTIKPRTQASLDEQIKKVRAKAETSLPKRPGPAAGVATLEKGVAQVRMRKLVAKKGDKDSKP